SIGTSISVNIWSKCRWRDALVPATVRTLASVGDPMAIIESYCDLNEFSDVRPSLRPVAIAKQAFDLGHPAIAALVAISAVQRALASDNDVSAGNVADMVGPWLAMGERIREGILSTHDVSGRTPVTEIGKIVASIADFLAVRE